MNRELLRVENLSVAYGDTQVVKGIDFSLRRVGMALWSRSATARPASTRSWWPPWSASTASTSRRCNGSG